MSTVNGAWRGPNIVKDGLVLYLDAGSPNSYYATTAGTTWKDISTPNSTLSGSLTNGVAYTGSNEGTFVFDGVDDYVITTYNTALIDFTVGVWFKSNGPNNSYNRIIDKDYISGFWLGRNANVINSWGGGIQEPGAPFGRYITLTDGQWHYIVSRREGTTHTIFGDGITNTTSGTVSSAALNTTSIRIGTQFGLGAYLNGNIANLQIYNRALNTTEILQNYNATKTRFGL